MIKQILLISIQTDTYVVFLSLTLITDKSTVSFIGNPRASIGLWIKQHISVAQHCNRFYLAALKCSGVLSSPGRAVGQAAGQTSPVSTLPSVFLFRIIFKHGKDINCPKSSIWPNGPFNESINFGIPGFILHVKVIKFATNVVLHLFIDTGARLNQSRENFVNESFAHFPTSRSENHHHRSHICNFWLPFINYTLAYFLGHLMGTFIIPGYFLCWVHWRMLQYRIGYVCN